MRLLNRKSQLQRLLETVGDSLDVPSRVKGGRPGGSSRIKVGLPSVGSSNGLKLGVPKDKAVKAGLVAGGLVGLTAGSAGISSLRRRKEGARDDS
jgi:hypothetical protein